MLRLFSALLEHPGNQNVPVVDVHYDLSTIQAVQDPCYFLRERWELYQYVPRTKFPLAVNLDDRVESLNASHGGCCKLLLGIPLSQRNAN